MDESLLPCIRKKKKAHARGNSREILQTGIEAGTRTVYVWVLPIFGAGIEP